MSAEITHTIDEETGHYVQRVSPEHLREMLDEDGENYDRPNHFGPEDEWEVGDAEEQAEYEAESEREQAEYEAEYEAESEREQAESERRAQLGG